jgi:hypothetical protein
MLSAEIAPADLLGAVRRIETKGKPRFDPTRDLERALTIPAVTHCQRSSIRPG